MAGGRGVGEKGKQRAEAERKGKGKKIIRERRRKTDARRRHGGCVGGCGVGGKGMNMNLSSVNVGDLELCGGGIKVGAMGLL